MLNISKNSVKSDVNVDQLQSFQEFNSQKPVNVLSRIIIFSSLAFGILLFVPWTQNIKTSGKVTTLLPNQRPQTVHSTIAGRIEEWFVKEGDFVSSGDTIAFLSEIKGEYLDPQLLDRTKDQLASKEMAVSAYMEKVKALDLQIDALTTAGGLKFQQAQNYLEQAKLTVKNDSIEVIAAKTNFDIARVQLERMEGLYEDGLKSLTELEKRRLTYQKAQADLISQENKLLGSKNKLITAQIELGAIQAEYKDDIAKAESEKFTALSAMYDAEAVVTKLQNQFMNYSVRTGMYYITSPQDGYVTQTLQSGIGETVKEGESIVSIMPAQYDLAVEMYIDPIDLPLIEKGQSVAIQFDGWPAIVFSGWPNANFGTFQGEIFAIDRFINPQGKYRVLVQPAAEDASWPSSLRIGVGTSNLLLLKDVPVWYELWRNINGFPPDFYSSKSSPTPVNK